MAWITVVDPAMHIVGGRGAPTILDRAVARIPPGPLTKHAAEFFSVSRKRSAGRKSALRRGASGARAKGDDLCDAMRIAASAGAHRDRVDRHTEELNVIRFRLGR
jgi:hypothetical protein